MTAPRRPDWVSIVHRCATIPLPFLLPAVEDALDGLVQRLDVWLWDAQHRSVQSLRTTERVEDDPIRTLTERHDLVGDLAHQGDPLGVVTADAPGDVDPAERDVAFAVLTAVLATAVRANEATVDTVHRRRRRHPMALPAEIQAGILPPGRFAVDGAELSATVEPAYDTGGDVFDYALDGERLFIAVLDAMGHGLRAAQLSVLAAGAMRRSRRLGHGLEEIAAEITTSLAVGASGEFVSAVLVDLDISTWQGTWLSAGHLPPLLVADDHIAELPLTPALPLGLVIGGEASRPTARPFHMAPGESLVLFSDGVVENPVVATGDPVGDVWFRDVLARRCRGAAAAGSKHVAADVLGEILETTGPDLRDDATLLVLQRAISGSASPTTREG